MDICGLMNCILGKNLPAALYFVGNQRKEGGLADMHAPLDSEQTDRNIAKEFVNVLNGTSKYATYI